LSTAVSFYVIWQNDAVAFAQDADSNVVTNAYFDRLSSASTSALELKHFPWK